MTDLVADAHSDLLMELVHAEDALGERDPLASRWLPLLERGGVGLLLSLEGAAAFGDDGWRRDVLSTSTGATSPTPSCGRSPGTAAWSG